MGGRGSSQSSQEALRQGLETDAALEGRVLTPGPSPLSSHDLLEMLPDCDPATIHL